MDGGDVPSSIAISILWHDTSESYERVSIFEYVV